jgi:hypothetical protein
VKGDAVSSKKIWFITGAGRGMGVDFAKAALAAGLVGFETESSQRMVNR